MMGLTPLASYIFINSQHTKCWRHSLWSYKTAVCW